MAEQIKKEPEDVEMENADEIIGSPKSFGGLELNAMYESIKAAASVNMKQNREIKKEMENKNKERENDDYTWSYMCPDRTMSDFYCKICDSHMNSEQMWESHISGKRHLKNVNKEPGEMPSKVRAIKIETLPKLMDAIKNVHEPLVGLGFMTELQRYDKSLNPSYTCHLCQANCTWSVVIDHILGTKHRLAYLKTVDPNEYEIIENMELQKITLDQLAEDRAREYEKKKGCGTMEVKLEKPKLVPPPPPPRIKSEDESSFGRHSRSPSSESSRYCKQRSVHSMRSRSRSPAQRWPSPPHSHDRRRSVDGKWRHDCYSPERVHNCTASTGALSAGLPAIASLPVSERIIFLRQIAQDFTVSSSNEIEEIKDIIGLLVKKILAYKIRQLPRSTQHRLAKQLAEGDIENFRDELRPVLPLMSDASSSIASSYNHHLIQRRDIKKKRLR